MIHLLALQGGMTTVLLAMTFIMLRRQRQRIEKLETAVRELKMHGIGMRNCLETE